MACTTHIIIEGVVYVSLIQPWRKEFINIKIITELCKHARQIKTLHFLHKVSDFIISQQNILLGPLRFWVLRRLK